MIASGTTAGDHDAQAMRTRIRAQRLIAALWKRYLETASLATVRQGAVPHGPGNECVLPSGTLFIEYVNLGFSGEMGSDIPSSLRLGTRSKEVPWVSPVSPAAYAT